MTGKTIDPKRERHRRFGCSRCMLISLLISTSVVMVICLFACVIPGVENELRRQKYQRIWNRRGSDDYTITISGGILPHDIYFIGYELTLEVCDRKIVRVNGVPCANSSHPENCASDPVSVLFREAQWGDGVKFDDEYGFPYQIEYPSIELTHYLDAYDYAPISCP